MRDSTGSFLQGRMMKVAGVISPFEAEARGVLEVLHWVEALDLHNV